MPCVRVSYVALVRVAIARCPHVRAQASSAGAGSAIAVDVATRGAHARPGLECRRCRCRCCFGRVGGCWWCGRWSAGRSQEEEAQVCGHVNVCAGHRVLLLWLDHCLSIRKGQDWLTICRRLHAHNITLSSSNNNTTHRSMQSTSKEGRPWVTQRQNRTANRKLLITRPSTLSTGCPAWPRARPPPGCAPARPWRGSRPWTRSPRSAGTACARCPAPCGPWGRACP